MYIILFLQHQNKSECLQHVYVFLIKSCLDLHFSSHVGLLCNIDVLFTRSVVIQNGSFGELHVQVVPCSTGAGDKCKTCKGIRERQVDPPKRVESWVVTKLYNRIFKGVCWTRWSCWSYMGEANKLL